MTTAFNIYADESCHLEHDGHEVMVLGATWCPLEEVKHQAEMMKYLKTKHRAQGELKWNRVSPSRLPFFLEVVDHFFDQDPLHFRALVVKDKPRLDHEMYNRGSHDAFYYKMHFYLLRNIINSGDQY